MGVVVFTVKQPPLQIESGRSVDEVMYLSFIHVTCSPDLQSVDSL